MTKTRHNHGPDLPGHNLLQHALGRQALHSAHSIDARKRSPHPLAADIEAQLPPDVSNLNRINADPMLTLMTLSQFSTEHSGFFMRQARDSTPFETALPQVPFYAPARSSTYVPPTKIWDDDSHDRGHVSRALQEDSTAEPLELLT